MKFKIIKNGNKRVLSKDFRENFDLTFNEETQEIEIEYNKKDYIIVKSDER